MHIWKSHVCSQKLDTSMQILHRIQKSRENGRSPRVFPDRIIFTSPFNDITDYGSRKVQNKCPAQANEVAICGARFRPGYLCFCGPGSEQARNRLGKTMGQGQRLVLLTWNGISSLPMMMSEFTTSKHLVFKQASNRSVDMKDRETLNALQSELQNNLILVNVVLASKTTKIYFCLLIYKNCTNL